MKNGRWCEISINGEITYIDWEYVELRAALFRKQTENRPVIAFLPQELEGLISYIALAVREQVLRTQLPDEAKK